LLLFTLPRRPVIGLPLLLLLLLLASSRSYI
jgi:hypothetical protein